MGFELTELSHQALATGAEGRGQFHDLELALFGALDSGVYSANDCPARHITRKVRLLPVAAHMPAEWLVTSNGRLARQPAGADPASRLAQPRLELPEMHGNSGTIAEAVS